MFETAGGLLSIDLSIIQANYRRLCDELNGKDCSVVVKADAYGLGIEPVSKALWEAGARTFFVALPDEGVELRHILPDADIHILGGLFKGAADVYTTHNLIPVLNSLEQIQDWQNRARADIQVDTGMTRLGIAPKDIPHIPSGLNTDVLMSHFACADERGHPLSIQQIETFTQAVQQIEHTRASLCNSAGIFLGEKAHFDLGRPVFSLWDQSNTPYHQSHAKPLHLQGKVIQVHEIDTQQSVGYGATYKLHAGQKLATIAVGYADGYLRSLSSKATVYVDGQAAKVVGRVSMDAIGIDVSAITCEEGQYVDVIGPDNTPDDLAHWAGTIGYEILTSLGNRYKRVYKG